MSFLQRNKFMMESFSRAYAHTLQEKDISISEVIQSKLDIKCGGYARDKCKECLQDKHLISDDEWADLENNKNVPEELKGRVEDAGYGVGKPGFTPNALGPCYGKCVPSECTKCLEVFLGKNLLEDNPRTNDTNALITNLGAAAGEYTKDHPPNKDGPCFPVCACVAKDITFNNFVVFQSATKIEQGDPRADIIAETVKKDMEKKFEDDWEPGFTKSIQQLVIKVSEEATANINQSIASISSVVIQGKGTVRAVDVTIVMDAIMKATITNNSAVDGFANLTDKLMNKIKSKIDNQMKTTFQYVWENVKNTVFVLIGVIVLFLLVNSYIYVTGAATKRTLLDTSPRSRVPATVQ